MDNVKVLTVENKHSIKLLLYVISSWKKCIPNKGYSRHWSIAKKKLFMLPLSKNGEIDFVFMENFIAELEADRIAELEAYLLTTGLKDYTLTTEEKMAIENLESGNLEWGEYRLGDLFEIEKTPSFNKDKLTNGKKYDYVTRTSLNQGILQETGFVNNENINLAGNWSLGLLQMDFFYRQKPWYAGQFMRKITSKIQLSKKSILYFSVLFNKLKGKLLSVLVRDVDKIFKNEKIQLPTQDKQPDYAFMENLISAIQKLVIKDVVLYADRKIEATKRAVTI